VAPGPVFAGVRLYLRAIPFFFLPAVYDFKESQIRLQLKFLLLMGFVQVPMSIYQRYHIMEQDRFSGDPVRGTLVDSSVLSIFLIGAVCILTGAFLQKRIGKIPFFLMFAVLLLPTTINETKATLILLPIGLVISAVVGSPPGRRMRIALLAFALLGAFGTGFAVIYDYVQRNNPYYVSIEDFFTDQGKLEEYVHQRNADVGGRRPGRVDAIVVPLRYLAKDPSTLAFGLGMGNCTHSALGEQFTGRYFETFELLLEATFSVFVLEIGVFGTALVMLLHWMIFQDSRAVATQDGGWLRFVAVGWTGITAIMWISMFYKITYVFAPLSYLFWYYSGLIAARRVQLVTAPRLVPQPVAVPGGYRPPALTTLGPRG
jgi:hypothetical protein